MLKDKYTFQDLLDIMTLLRSENGCPWDREQNHESLKKYLIEETYEVLEAIDLKNTDKLSEELGDVLLQVVFHAQIGKDAGTFTIDDVITGICRKMILRHTHVFGNDKADTPDEVVSNWEEIKKKEKGLKNQAGVLKDVPSILPALMRGYKVQQKAAQVGFDWDNISDVIKKVHEEIGELEEVIEGDDKDRIADEMGDCLFSLVNLSRFLKIQPELALTGTIEKFIKRFEYVESKSIESGRKMEEMTLQEMDRLWEASKIHIK